MRFCKRFGEYFAWDGAGRKLAIATGSRAILCWMYKILWCVFLCKVDNFEFRARWAHYHASLKQGFRAIWTSFGQDRVQDVVRDQCATLKEVFRARCVWCRAGTIATVEKQVFCCHEGCDIAWNRYRMKMGFHPKSSILADMRDFLRSSYVCLTYFLDITRTTKVR